MLWARRPSLIAIRLASKPRLRVVRSNITGSSTLRATYALKCGSSRWDSHHNESKAFPLSPLALQRWLNPDSLQPEVLPGAEPFWPPGFELSPCSSSDAGECALGCALAFNPHLAPVIPSPTPPPARPVPPAPWPNPSPGFNFSVALSSHMVLQQGPGAAAVFGAVGSNDSAADISVTVTPSTGGGSPYTVPAAVSGGRWKALLRPTAAASGVTFTIVATCTAGCGGAAQAVSLEDVVFVRQRRGWGGAAVPIHTSH